MDYQTALDNLNYWIAQSKASAGAKTYGVTNYTKGNHSATDIIKMIDYWQKKVNKLNPNRINSRFTSIVPKGI